MLWYYWNVLYLPFNQNHDHDTISWAIVCDAFIAKCLVRKMKIQWIMSVNSMNSYYTALYTTHSCWHELLSSISCMSPLAVLTVLLNLVVFTNILSSKALRKTVSMLLVCNLALSDFLIGVYFLCIVIYWNSTPFSDIYASAARNCSKIGYLWMLGQSSTVSTSLLLTVERYLVIVYTMNPDLRISRRMAIILVIFSWFVTFILTGYALYYNLYSASILCVPIRSGYDPNFFNAYVFTI